MALYPSLYQINTRVWLRELSSTLGHPATLADIPDSFLDQIASMGFDYVWFLGLWQTGPAGRQVSLSHPEWLQEYPGNPFRFYRGRHQRFALRGDGLHPASRLQPGGRASPPERATPEKKTQAHGGLRPQPHRPGPSLGAGPSGVLCPGERKPTWSGSPTSIGG